MEGVNDFCTKAVSFGGVPRTILLQDHNGPCPLIALVNCLSLAGQIDLPLPAHPRQQNYSTKRPEFGSIQESVVYSILGDRLWKYSNRFLETYSDPQDQHQNDGHHRADEGATNEFKEKPANPLLANARYEITRALDVLPSLRHGLNLNVKFDRIDGFEYTPELAVFDLTAVRLVHGWVVDPAENDGKLLEIVRSKSYNQIVDELAKIQSASAVASSSSSSSVQADDGEVDDDKWAEAEVEVQDSEVTLVKDDPLLDFLENSRSQLTSFGLAELRTELPDLTLAILFRNNHFSTILKRFDQLYVLVTDNVLARQNGVCWESLSIDGDSVFYDCSFVLTSPHRQHYEGVPPLNVGLSDHSLAAKLQREEMEKADREVAQMLQQQYEASPETRPRKSKQQKKKKASKPKSAASPLVEIDEERQPLNQQRPRSLMSRLSGWCSRS